MVAPCLAPCAQACACRGMLGTTWRAKGYMLTSARHCEQAYFLCAMRGSSADRCTAPATHMLRSHLRMRKSLLRSANAQTSVAGELLLRRPPSGTRVQVIAAIPADRCIRHGRPRRRRRGSVTYCHPGGAQLAGAQGGGRVLYSHALGALAADMVGKVHERYWSGMPLRADQSMPRSTSTQSALWRWQSSST